MSISFPKIDLEQHRLIGTIAIVSMAFGIAVQSTPARAFDVEIDSQANRLYIVIWNLVNGQWKLHRDIWNSTGQ